MKVLFFPHDQKFWLDHGLFMLFLAATQMVIIIPLYEYARFLFFCDLFWFPFFTIAVLLFRYLYKTLGWESFSSRQFLEYSLIYSLSSGLTIAILMSAIFSSFYWSEIITTLVPNSSNRTITKLIMGSILGNWIQTTIFISAWIFLYHSITSSKRARETELRYLRAQHSLKDATLNSLSNQLNPHFLFNALNNIRFMVHESPKKADHMITSLSEILRYSLESSRYEKVILADEIAIIHRYIEIVKSQLEDRLDFTLSIQPNFDTYLVPPMVLQMLIENGIKHGIENIKTGGQLSVTCEELESKLIFTVCNHIAHEIKKGLPSTGIGLKNIKQRLELLYGDTADLQTAKTENQFIVRLTIPKEISQ